MQIVEDDYWAKKKPALSRSIKTKWHYSFHEKTNKTEMVYIVGRKRQWYSNGTWDASTLE